MVKPIVTTRYGRISGLNTACRTGGVGTFGFMERRYVRRATAYRGSSGRSGHSCRWLGRARRSGGSPYGGHARTGAELPTVKSPTWKARDFTALELVYEPVSGALWFKREPLAEFCLCNDQDPDRVLADLDLACCFIALWYCLHRQHGGAPDHVAERIVAEVVAHEDSTLEYPQDGSTRIH